MKYTVVIWALGFSIPATLQCFESFEQHHMEKRAIEAARTLRSIYVVTENESRRIVYANA